jgi:6-pyruvoyltetrahydropterin/6-carboxytetrahydropterin synthase
MELMKEFKFEASHVLPKHPGKCSRLHGHSWKLRVYVKGEVDKETGFVIDYGDIKQSVQPIIDALDHRHLGTWLIPYNDISFRNADWEVHYMPREFYPTSENLIVWIGDQLLNHKLCMSLGWSKLELDETCTSSCILTREEYAKQIRG